MNSAPAAQFSKEESATLRRSVVEASIANERYLRAHPEVADVLSYALSEALLAQPSEPVTFIEAMLADTDLHALHQKILSERRQ